MNATRKVRADGLASVLKALSLSGKVFPEIAGNSDLRLDEVPSLLGRDAASGHRHVRLGHMNCHLKRRLVLENQDGLMRLNVLEIIHQGACDSPVDWRHQSGVVERTLGRAQGRVRHIVGALKLIEFTARNDALIEQLAPAGELRLSVGVIRARRIHPRHKIGFVETPEQVALLNHQALLAGRKLNQPAGHIEGHI